MCSKGVFNRINLGTLWTKIVQCLLLEKLNRIYRLVKAAIVGISLKYKHRKQKRVSKV
jgi:hypothetical protein